MRPRDTPRLKTVAVGGSGKRCGVALALGSRAFFYSITLPDLLSRPSALDCFRPRLHRRPPPTPTAPLSTSATATMKTIHKRIYSVLPRPAAVASSTASSSQLPLVPRVRSNSASSPRTLYTASHLSFLDAAGQAPPPPPPSSRGNPNVIVGTRLAAEVRAEIEGPSNASSHQQSGHLPYSLALTLGQTDASSHLPISPYNPFLPYQSLSPLFVYSAKSPEPPAPESRKKRQRTRYQLDVGAYGIPKRSRGPCVAGRDGHGRFDGRAESGHEELSRAVQVGEDAYFVRDNAMGVADGVGGWSRHRRTRESI